MVNGLIIENYFSVKKILQINFTNKFYKKNSKKKPRKFQKKPTKKTNKSNF